LSSQQNAEKEVNPFVFVNRVTDPVVTQATLRNWIA